MNKHLKTQDNQFVPTEEKLFAGMERKKVPYQITQPLVQLLSQYVGLKKKFFRRYLRRNPQVNSFFVDGINAKSRGVKEGAASWRSLDIIYNKEPGDGLVTDFWFDIPNAQAVRNRLKISKRLLYAALRKRKTETGKGTEENPLHLYSIAAGSAQGVIEVVARLKQEDVHVTVVLVDSDPFTKGIVTKHAEANQVLDRVTVMTDRADRFDKLCAAGTADVIEMLGLMDYLVDPIAIRLCRKIYKSLDVGGVFLTCHIHENPGVDFLRHVLDWGEEPYMYYRSKEKLGNLVRGGYFEKIQIFTEPHEIHSIALAVK